MRGRLYAIDRADVPPYTPRVQNWTAWRRGAMTTVLGALISASQAFAAPSAVLVSGGTALFVLDGNGDGPGAGDCVFTATVDPPSLSSSSFVLSPTQDTTLPLRGCGGTSSGNYFAGSDSSSDYVGIDLANSNIPASGQANPGLFEPALVLDVFEEFDGAPNGQPIAVNTIEVQSPGDGGEGDVRASIQLCGRGGVPSAIVHRGPFSLRLELPLYPDAQNPTHVRLPNMHLERLDTPGTFSFVDGYVPLTNGHVTVSLANAPATLLGDIDLAQLPPCPSSVRAPTLTQYGLVLAMLAALSGGVWRIRRARRIASRN